MTHKLWFGSAVLALALLVLSGAQQDVVLFNHSPSVPVGFYVRGSDDPGLGMFVTVRARDVAPIEATAHDYDDEGDRFIKRLAAIALGRAESLTASHRNYSRILDDPR